MKITQNTQCLNFETFFRSNQDTCLSQRPLIEQGQWVGKGQLLADSINSVSGDLALGKNVLVAYMPWEGYNFEDSIVISDRLIADDVYTSIHVLRFRTEVLNNLSTSHNKPQEPSLLVPSIEGKRRPLQPKAALLPNKNDLRYNLFLLGRRHQKANKLAIKPFYLFSHSYVSKLRPATASYALLAWSSASLFCVPLTPFSSYDPIYRGVALNAEEGYFAGWPKKARTTHFLTACKSRPAFYSMEDSRVDVPSERQRLRLAMRRGKVVETSLTNPIKRNNNQNLKQSGSSYVQPKLRHSEAMLELAKIKATLARITLISSTLSLFSLSFYAPKIQRYKFYPQFADLTTPTEDKENTFPFNNRKHRRAAFGESYHNKNHLSPRALTVSGLARAAKSQIAIRAKNDFNKSRYWNKVNLSYTLTEGKEHANSPRSKSFFIPSSLRAHRCNQRAEGNYHIKCPLLWSRVAKSTNSATIVEGSFTRAKLCSVKYNTIAQAGSWVEQLKLRNLLLKTKLPLAKSSPLISTSLLRQFCLLAPWLTTTFGGAKLEALPSIRQRCVAFGTSEGRTKTPHRLSLPSACEARKAGPTFGPVTEARQRHSHSRVRLGAKLGLATSPKGVLSKLPAAKIGTVKTSPTLNGTSNAAENKGVRDVSTILKTQRRLNESRHANNVETRTSNIPFLGEHLLSHLDQKGIAKVGTWVSPGDILVGKVRPLANKLKSNRASTQLAWEIISSKKNESINVEDKSFRLPKGVSGRVIRTEILPTVDNSTGGNNEQIHIYLAVKRKVQVGDKLAGRHGNKGIVSLVLPRQDMPYLADGTPIDIVLSPLGVPSRMNVGQIYECLLGLAAKSLLCHFKVNHSMATLGFTYNSLTPKIRPNFLQSTSVARSTQSTSVALSTQSTSVALSTQSTSVALSTQNTSVARSLKSGQRLTLFRQLRDYLPSSRRQVAKQKSSIVSKTLSYINCLSVNNQVNATPLFATYGRAELEVSKYEKENIQTAFDGSQMTLKMTSHKSSICENQKIYNTRKLYMAKGINQLTSLKNKYFTSWSLWSNSSCIYSMYIKYLITLSTGFHNNLIAVRLGSTEKQIKDTNNYYVGTELIKGSTAISNKIPFLRAKLAQGIHWSKLNNKSNWQNLSKASKGGFTRVGPYGRKPKLEDSSSNSKSLANTSFVVPVEKYFTAQNNARYLPQSVARVSCHNLGGRHLTSELNLGKSYKLKEFKQNKQLIFYSNLEARNLVFLKLYHSRITCNKKWLFSLTNPGKMKLFDGRTGQPFSSWVTVGYAYMLKLIHLVDNKIHSRSTGPYSLITRQPVTGKARQGGQRIGEMEAWALEGFGAAYTLQEFFSFKGDDVSSRHQWQINSLSKLVGNTTAFKTFLSELRALCISLEFTGFTEGSVT